MKRAPASLIIPAHNVTVESDGAVIVYPVTYDGDILIGVGEMDNGVITAESMTEVYVDAEQFLRGLIALGIIESYTLPPPPASIALFPKA